jgi:predicted CxxxxCH...CXXCH cytochrome family protein
MCHGAVTDNAHVNGSVGWNMAALGTAAQYKTPTGAFSQSGSSDVLAPSATFGQCSNIYCHSNVQGSAGVGGPTTYAQPAWGGAAQTCGSCHKDMSTDSTATGSHVKHAQAAGLACASCHNGMGRDAASHADGFINLAFSGAAGGTNYSKGASFTPGKGYGSCSASYCHGATLPASNPPRPAPAWNTPFPTGNSVLGNGIAGGSNPGSGACTQCHGYPPQNNHPTSGCNGCHTHLNPDNLTFNNPSLHMNGVIDVVGNGGACDSCHGYPPVSVGIVGTHNNWSSARVENYLGGGGAHTIQNHISKLAKASEGFGNCSPCHDAADHQMSPIAFNPSQNIKVKLNQRYRLEAAKQTRYTSNRLNAGSHLTGTCSNSSCHYGATPKWDPAH